MEVNIVPVLIHYGVDFHETGRREQQILCPVHLEQVPSCSVNTEKNVIHCQACGFGGDAIALIIEKEGIDFAAAVQVAQKLTGEVGEGLSRPARRRGVGLSGRQGAWRPRYRNQPPTRRRANPDGGA